MHFQSQVRNRYGKCDLPGNTVRRIREGLDSLGIQIDWAYRHKVSDHLYWAALYCTTLAFGVVGKGMTPELAEASAYAEFVERLAYPPHWGIAHYNLVCTAVGGAFSTYQWVEGYLRSHQENLEECVRVEELIPEELGLSQSDLDYIKTTEVAQHWVDGYCLGRDRRVKVPITFITTIAGSNGLAAGNTLEEAVIHAACEAFERYALIRVIRRRERVPTLDLPSVLASAPMYGHAIVEMVNTFRANNVDVVFKDLSINGLLPCVGVLFVNKNLRKDHVEYRMLQPGAAFHFEEAVIRCFTERMQGRTNFGPSPETLGQTVRDKVDNYELLLRARICEEDISYLESGDTVGIGARAEFTDLLDELTEVRRICERMGTDCVIVNLTHPLLRFPTVRVVIPRVSDTLLYHVGREVSGFAERQGQHHRAVIESFFMTPSAGQTELLGNVV